MEYSRGSPCKQKTVTQYWSLQVYGGSAGRCYSQGESVDECPGQRQGSNRAVPGRRLHGRRARKRRNDYSMWYFGSHERGI